MARTIALCRFVALLACTTIILWVARSEPLYAANDHHANVAQFERELQALAASLKIPGVAYAIVEDGRPLARGAFGVTQEDRAAAFTTGTPLRIASVTKGLTATIAMQLVEEGRLDLAAPANRYLQEQSLPDGVQVQHLLTHSSEGLVGEEYVYGTSRYGKLREIVQAASGQSLEQAVRQRIVERAGMRWHPSPDLGAQGGFVSTVDDMTLFIAALDRGALLSERSLQRLATPSELKPGRPLPVSLGWFAQTVQGEPLMWSYGQDDEDHSGALLLRLPERKLTLFVLANANMISDPFRLLMGDVSKSPVAMSFLRLFAFSPPDQPLPQLPGPGEGLDQWLDARESNNRYRYRDELFASAMLDAWHQRKDAFGSKLALARRRYGPLAPDAVLHFAAMQVGWADPEPADWGRKLLADHPDNRWILLSQGYALQRAGADAEASRCFERILALPNQEPDYLALLFKGWSWSALADMVREEDPGRARAYLMQILDSGVGDPIKDNAAKALKELGG